MSTKTQIDKAIRKKFQPPFEILEIREMAMPDASTVQIITKIQGDVVVSSGSARRARGDDPNPELGYMIALSRALESLQRRVNRRAEGMVRHMDNIAAHHEELARSGNTPKRTVLPAIQTTRNATTKGRQGRRTARVTTNKK